MDYAIYWDPLSLSRVCDAEYRTGNPSRIGTVQGCPSIRREQAVKRCAEAEKTGTTEY